MSCVDLLKMKVSSMVNEIPIKQVLTIHMLLQHQIVTKVVNFFYD